MRTLIVRLAVCALALAGASAQAYVMTLQPQSDTAAKIANATSGSVSIATYSVSSGRLLIETGAVAADISRDLAYFVVNPDPLLARGAKPQIRVFAYGSTYAGPPGVVDAPAGRYFGGVYYDAGATRLIGWLHDATTTTAPAPLQLFKLATSSGTAFGSLTTLDTGSGCCLVEAAVSAWRSRNKELLVIGRRTGDTEDQLLRFLPDSGAATIVPDAFPLAGERVVALAVDTLSNTLYGVSRSATDVTRLVRITYTTSGTPATLSPVGSAAACCYAAPGAAAVDTDANGRALFVLVRAVPASPATATVQQLGRFDLTTGAYTAVNRSALGIGLWQDDAVDFARLFRTPAGSAAP